MGEESEEGGRGEIGWNGAKKKDFFFFFFDLLFKEGIFCFVFKSVNNKTLVNKKETEREKMKLKGKKEKKLEAQS